MTATADKLNEAKYFLDRAKESPFHTDAFRYNISAFLSASRSITFMMKKEFFSVPGFEKWYEKKVGEMRQDKFMKYLDRQRDITIHERPVQSHPHVSLIEETTGEGTKDLVVLYHLMGTGGATVNVVRSRPLITTAKPTGKIRCCFDDILDEDVMTLCEKHIAKLSKITNECESNFQAPT
ncbi:MAG: hypothetical protein HYZ52_00880 [Candidatus Omnitrophica bacterium]|nr:hypothetical protein [Candidatus Omnitrophota bacterium]